MKKIMIISSILIVAVWIAGVGYCREDIPDDALRTFDGKVVSVDLAGSNLTVNGGFEMTFPVTSGTKFVNEMYVAENAEDLKLSQLKKGDYVSVGYYTDDSGGIKTITVSLKFEKSKDNAYPS